MRLNRADYRTLIAAGRERAQQQIGSAAGYALAALALIGGIVLAFASLLKA